jgi:hypothetical protein
MFKNLSFKMKLLLSILPMVIVGMLTLSGTALYQFRKTIQDEIVNNRITETNKLSENVNTWLEGKLLEVRSAANTPTAKLIESNLDAVDKFNLERIKFLEKNYPGEYDNASATLFNNDGISRVQKQIENIAEKMNKGTNDVMHGVDITTSVGKNFEEVEKVFNEISSIVVEVSQAANSMSNKANTTDEVISNVAAITEENSAATEQVTALNEEQTACMNQIGETTNKLEELVGNLKNTVDRFKI